MEKQGNIFKYFLRSFYFILLAHAIAVSVSEAAECKAWRKGIDYSGGNYKDVRNIDKPIDCLRLCEQEEQCKHWTWLDVGFGSWSLRCYMKDHYNLVKNDANFVSGDKGCDLDSGLPEGCFPHNGTAYTGDALLGEPFSTPNWELCSQLCYADAKCKHWTFTGDIPSTLSFLCYHRETSTGVRTGLLKEVVSGSRPCIKTPITEKPKTEENGNPISVSYDHIFPDIPPRHTSPTVAPKERVKPTITHAAVNLTSTGDFDFIVKEFGNRGNLENEIKKAIISTLNVPETQVRNVKCSQGDTIFTTFDLTNPSFDNSTFVEHLDKIKGWSKLELGEEKPKRVFGITHATYDVVYVKSGKFGALSDKNGSSVRVVVGAIIGVLAVIAIAIVD